MKSSCFPSALAAPARLPALLLLIPLLWWNGGCADSPKPDSANSGDGAPQTATDTGRAQAYASKVRFRSVTQQTGIDFSYRDGREAEHYAVLETVGGGLAAFDYDCDGDVDLFFPGGGRFLPDQQIRGLRPALYANRGGWKFEEFTAPAGFEAAVFYSHGVAVSDYDNDGFGDLLVTGYGGVQFFRNMGDGTFAETAAAAGLDDTLWSASAAWGDVNRDGFPDLYVTHYLDWSFENHPRCRAAGRAVRRDVCPPGRFQGLPDTFYHNNGDGTFRNASELAGLRKDGKGLGVLIGDVDLDGDLDVYVANDTVENFLYQNDGSGRFEEIGLYSATAYDAQATADGSMGVDLGDYNLDGRPDLWVANFESESFALYRNEGNAAFTHVSGSTGITAVGGLFVGWGTAFLDFDRDGDEDLVSANGHIMRHPVNAPILQRPLLFKNLGGKRFVNVAPAIGGYFAAEHESRGLATADFDRDGDTDLVVSHINAPVEVLSNETENDHHWLSLRLIGVESPRDAVGAVVHLRSARGEQMRQVIGGGSYLSHCEKRLLFGLGDDNKIDHLRIRWPSGTEQVVNNPSVDTMLTIRESSAVIKE